MEGSISTLDRPKFTNKHAREPSYPASTMLMFTSIRPLRESELVCHQNAQTLGGSFTRSRMSTHTSWRGGTR